jgi:membrane protein implicated in regulation of membrane protease activity
LPAAKRGITARGDDLAAPPPEQVGQQAAHGAAVIGDEDFHWASAGCCPDYAADCGGAEQNLSRVGRHKALADAEGHSYLARVALIITLLAVGAVLLLLETVLPGLIAGILGIICLIAGVVLSFRDYGAETGGLVLLGTLVGLGIGTALWVKYFPDSRCAQVFIAKKTVGELGVERPELLEQTGVAHTTLRPSGTAIINGERVDVVTEGSLIERGTPIKVVATEGMRVIVRTL